MAAEKADAMAAAAVAAMAATAARRAKAVRAAKVAAPAVAAKVAASRAVQKVVLKAVREAAPANAVVNVPRAKAEWKVVAKAAVKLRVVVRHAVNRVAKAATVAVETTAVMPLLPMARKTMKCCSTPHPAP